MDIQLARTFLAIVETGSFQEAAERVHVTQSTVSMRVRSLEEQLGQTLFLRGKSGAALTQAGAKFHRHALTLVRVWEQAKLDAALPAGASVALAIGAQLSLWDGFLVEWIGRMRQAAPDVALKAELAAAATLIGRMTDGALDIAVVYAPQQRPGFLVERLFDEELVLATSASDGAGVEDAAYVFVDWGPDFAADHALAFSTRPTPSLRLGIGTLGLQYLLARPASGYFPRRAVAPEIARGALRLVEDAPRFRYPVYALVAEAAPEPAAGQALALLRSMAAEMGEPDA